MDCLASDIVPMRRIMTILLLPLLLAGCARVPVQSSGYGVFLSVEEDIDSLNEYSTVVIDAQNFSKSEIADFKKDGHEVYTYINIGSLEDWRDYYDDYSDLALGTYEHWEDEVWIDVSSVRWQEFVIYELIPELTDKGVDGFFVDNCDVYYNYPSEEIMDGLTVMMEAMVDTGKKVIINGGDTYLDAYCDAGGSWSDVITGINQETVFSKILWDGDEFGKASKSDHEYFLDYVERYADMGADIYLLEYTTDPALISEIAEYCDKNGFEYYVSDSIELD